MKKNLIAKYIDQAKNEKFHNFQPDSEGAEKFMYVSGAATAPMSACVEQVTASDPYIFTIENANTVTSQKAVLFGGYANISAVNQGSDPGITIRPESGASYLALLQQISSNPFMAMSWRLDSDSASQLNATMFVNYTNAANGKSARVPIALNVRRNLYYQNQNGQEFNYPVKIDGNTSIEINILKGNTLTVTIFPQAVADNTQQFSNRPAVKQYELPTLSAMQTVPVAKDNFVIAGMPTGKG